MLEELSITRQLNKERAFTPPFCSNPDCKFHTPTNFTFFEHYGFNTLKRFPYKSHRFRCKECGKTFTHSYFQLHYRQKLWGGNSYIFDQFRKGVSKCEIARSLKIQERCVRERLTKMSRWSLLYHAKKSAHLKIREALVYDGLENFSFSQYEPNNINHMVGEDSLFIYDFNFAPINRKGRMSPRQRYINKRLSKKHGKFPGDIIRSTTKRIVKRMMQRTKSLVLITDRHFQYHRAIHWDLRKYDIEHIKVSSKIARNFKNRLFAVNNIDLMARHNLAPFKRETIAFSKHSVAMQEAFMIYTVFRNYMRPKFYKKHKADPSSNKISPAMDLGLENKILSFEDVFAQKIARQHVSLNQDMVDLYERRDPYSRHKISPAA